MDQADPAASVRLASTVQSRQPRASTTTRLGRAICGRDGSARARLRAAGTPNQNNCSAAPGPHRCMPSHHPCAERRQRPRARWPGPGAGGSGQPWLRSGGSEDSRRGSACASADDRVNGQCAGARFIMAPFAHQSDNCWLSGKGRSVSTRIAALDPPITGCHASQRAWEAPAARPCPSRCAFTRIGRRRRQSCPGAARGAANACSFPPPACTTPGIWA